MKFNVEFYETGHGRRPMSDFLEKLKQSDPNDFAIVMAGLAKLRNQQYHKPPLSKPIGSGFFELRHVGKLNTRLLYFFAKGQRIIAVHAIRNKAREISKWDLELHFLPRAKRSSRLKAAPQAKRSALQEDWLARAQ